MKRFKTLFFFWPGLWHVELNGGSHWQQHYFILTIHSFLCHHNWYVRRALVPRGHCILVCLFDLLSEVLSMGHVHWSAWKKSWNDAVVYVLFSFTKLKSLNLEVFQKAQYFCIFPLDNRFVTYDPVNIKDHYLWGILVYILIFLSGVLLWVEF